MRFKKTNIFSCPGYHGTSKLKASLIMASKFNPSVKASWFGKGIYFFGDMLPYVKGSEEARKWAISVKHELQWAVLKVEIQSERAFDVFGNDRDRRRFLELREELFKIHIQSGRDESDFEDRLLFIKIEETGHFEVIRAVVDPRRKGYITYIVPQLQVQICVKRDSAIKSKKIIMEGR